MKDRVLVCSHCGALTALDQTWDGWCLSCVMNWGHPDDVEAVSRVFHGWTREADLAAILHVSTPVVRVPSMLLAIQSFGTLDLTTGAARGKGRVNVEQRTIATA